MTRKKVTVTSSTPDTPELVPIQTTPPHAVYIHGSQQTGLIPDVPFDQAVDWMRRGWVTYAIHQP